MSKLTFSSHNVHCPFSLLFAPSIFAPPSHLNSYLLCHMPIRPALLMDFSIEAPPIVILFPSFPAPRTKIFSTSSMSLFAFQVRASHRTFPNYATSWARLHVGAKSEEKFCSGEGFDLRRRGPYFGCERSTFGHKLLASLAE